MSIKGYLGRLAYDVKPMKSGLGRQAAEIAGGLVTTTGRTGVTLDPVLFQAYASPVFQRIFNSLEFFFYCCFSYHIDLGEASGAVKISFQIGTASRLTGSNS